MYAYRMIGQDHRRQMQTTHQCPKKTSNQSPALYIKPFSILQHSLFRDPLVPHFASTIRWLQEALAMASLQPAEVTEPPGFSLGLVDVLRLARYITTWDKRGWSKNDGCEIIHTEMDPLRNFDFLLTHNLRHQKVQWIGLIDIIWSWKKESTHQGSPRYSTSTIRDSSNGQENSWV